MPRLACVAAIVGLCCLAPVAAAERQLQFVLPSFPFPDAIAITATTAGQPGPDAEDAQPIASIATVEELLTLPDAGPYDIWLKPRNGLAVPILRNIRVEEGTRKVPLGDVLGGVFVRGDDLPRAEFMALTAEDDPGPEERGYAPVQMAEEYRVPLVVPEGFYSLWVKPANGARAQRVVDRIRVLVGKEVEVD